MLFKNRLCSTFAIPQLRSLLFITMLALLAFSASRTTQGAATINLPVPFKINVPPGIIYGDSFGNSLAVDGDFMVVGAWRTNVGENKQQGVVYLFARDAANPLLFNHIKTLTGADSYAFQGFGTAVAIHGDTIAIGAMHDDPDGHFDAGSVYVFERNHGGADAWGEVAKLFDVNYDDEFSEHAYLGQSVAIHGDIVVAGAPQDRGRAFVFGRNQGGIDQWQEIQFLTSENYWEKGSFGSSVATDGQRIVVGGMRSNMVPGFVFNNEGAAFVYEYDGSKWVLVTKLHVADDDRDTHYGDDSKFGETVAIRGEMIFVGAPSMTINDIYGIGEVYAFQRNGSGEWPLVKTFTANEAGAAADFGRGLYPVDNGLFISSDTGLDGNGMVHFFRTDAAQNAVNASSLQDAQAWTHVYSFTTSEDVERSNVGSEIAGSGNTLAIGANGYDGGRGTVFTYPLDVMVAVQPDAPPTDEPPTDEPPTGILSPAAYMPIVANAAQQLPTQMNGTLANNGMFSGPGGVKIGAVSGALTETIEIAMATISAPAEPLPSGVIARGGYFSLSSEETLFVNTETPFVVSVPVPAGVDTAHLALAHLQPAADLLDATAVGDFWSYLPGAYDVDLGVFLAKVPFLKAEGTSLVLVEHPDMHSWLNNPVPQVETAARLRSFSAYCFKSTFPDQDDCTTITETDVMVFMEVVYNDMVGTHGFPWNVRLHDFDTGFIVSESISLTTQSASYAVFIFHQSHDVCDGIGGSYNPNSGFLILCIAADAIVDDDIKDTLVHEFFHAIEYSYPVVLRDYGSGVREPWITEGMAMAAERSYDAPTLTRSLSYGADNLHEIDIALTTGVLGDELVDEYLAQDFWVYVGQSQQLELGYLGPILAVGGATTKGVAAAMKTVGNSNFEELYWGWVKNQVIENTYNLGSGPGQLCQLTTQALNGKHPSFPSHANYYPTGELAWDYVAPLTGKVVEILIPHTQRGVFVEVRYQECSGINDLVARASCNAAMQAKMPIKIYEEGEAACDQLGRGSRRLGPITPGGRYFVVIANADLEEEHGFALFLE